MHENEISKIIVDAAIEVHREIGGPGLLEDVYEESMAEELTLRGMTVERQLPVPGDLQRARFAAASASRYESERSCVG